MKWYWHVLRYEYANFRGRARRAEFWSFQIINHIILGAFLYMLLTLVTHIVGNLSGPIGEDAEYAPRHNHVLMVDYHPTDVQRKDDRGDRRLGEACDDVPKVENTVIALAVYLLLTAIPSLAVTVRRLHDAGFSGWLVLLHIIPNGMGSVALIILCSLESKPGTNEYGPNPKDNQEFQLSV